MNPYARQPHLPNGCGICSHSASDDYAKYRLIAVRYANHCEVERNGIAITAAATETEALKLALDQCQFGLNKVVICKTIRAIIRRLEAGIPADSLWPELYDLWPEWQYHLSRMDRTEAALRKLLRHSSLRPTYGSITAGTPFTMHLPNGQQVVGLKRKDGCLVLSNGTLIPHPSAATPVFTNHWPTLNH